MDMGELVWLEDIVDDGKAMSECFGMFCRIVEGLVGEFDGEDVWYSYSGEMD
jgi:hypothetical protein